MSPRLKPNEMAVILERIRTTFPGDVERIEQHIDSTDTENSFHGLVREMIESKEQSKAAEEKTVQTLLALKPVLEASAAALAKLAEEEKRRNDLTAREMTRQERAEEHLQGLQKLQYQDVVVPIVTALVGAITAWSAMTFAH